MKASKLEFKSSSDSIVLTHDTVLLGLWGTQMGGRHVFAVKASKSRWRSKPVPASSGTVLDRIRVLGR